MKKLSSQERETLIELSKAGASGNYDPNALSNLFTLDLVYVNRCRRVVLSAAGREFLRELQRREAG